MTASSVELEDSKELWIIDGPTEQFVASLVYSEKLKLLFLTCGFPQKHILAIRPDGSGNGTNTHVVWRDTAGAAYVPSPIVIGDYFIVVADNGVPSCFIAATGVSDSLLMATHWAFIRQLKKRHPTCQFVAHPSCLQADGIWTTGSLTGYFDALLEILAQDRGDAFAQLCATHLLVSTPEKINPILPGHRNHCDEAILKVQEWIETHYAQAITIERMGREVGMAERTLKRRFQLATRLSPNVYAQKVRVDKAKKLLLATDLSIKAIAYEVGYENVSFFVRVFKTHAGQTPSKWRRAGETSVRGH